MKRWKETEFVGNELGGVEMQCVKKEGGGGE